MSDPDASSEVSTSILTSFLKGAAAGLVALLFNFFLRQGGVAPFPPESGLEAFLRVIPESIQEPAVQQLGDFAGGLGLLIASFLAVVVYGFLGIIFMKWFNPQISKSGRLSVRESFLVYSFVPWLLFGVILLPIFDASLFGISSVFAGSNSFWLFPISLLFVQLVFSFSMYYFFQRASLNRSSSKKVSIGAVAEDPVRISRIGSTSNTRSVSRRWFLEKGVLGLGVIVLAAISFDNIISSLLSTSASPLSSPSSQIGPVNLQDAPSIFQDSRLAPLINNEVTANSSFYRVAIDLFDPSVDPNTWVLQVGGSVKEPKNYNLEDVKNLFTAIDQYNTFECVSNLINGNLIGNAKWTGVRISDLLNNVGGTTAGAEHVVFYSVDGYSVAVPLSRATMSDSLLAYMMNDQTLPQKHGFPLRAVIPGLYGMMSAKWINRIEVVNSPYEGYWQTRGWSDVGTVETASFLTIPGEGSSVSLSQYNGSVMLGGVAYAGDRGISKVEVSTDGGKTWQVAQLKPSLGNTTWTLWAFDWHPRKTGDYSVYARATDGTNSVQTSEQTGTFPNGATGYAMITVKVSR